MAAKSPPVYRFFAGKGGVGKTTCAAAWALSSAERGASVLVVSTDPAHSLGDALGRKLSSRGLRVPTRRGKLHAVELDADRALERWLDQRRVELRTLVERGTYLDREDIDRFLKLSLPGVDELVGLLELTSLAARARYDEIVVDTAPTGHTLRLLSMPETLRAIAEILDDMHAKHRFIAARLGGRYRPDSADRVIDDMDARGAELHRLLRDPERSKFTWVAAPELMAVEESKDAIYALERSGIGIFELIVNRVTPAPPEPCGGCNARRRAENQAIAALRAALPGKRLRLVPALESASGGQIALRNVGRSLAALVESRPRAPARKKPARTQPLRKALPGRARGVLERLVSKNTRLVIVGGKGGVGKTTCAAALALELAGARPKSRILLISSDPAHSIGDVLGEKLDDTARRVGPRGTRLFARELDAEARFARLRNLYRQSVEDVFSGLTRGSRFELAFDRAVMEDLIELAPPGLDELFGAVAIVEALLRKSPSHYDVVVLDTAPTGHTLRLLAMPETALAWIHALLSILLKYREIIGLGQLATDLLDAARKLRSLSDLLHDADRTRFVAVSRLEELPLLETRRLLRELSRLRISVSGVIANHVWHGSCSRCRRLMVMESLRLRGLRRLAGQRPLLRAPADPSPPRGAAGLLDWSRRWEMDAG